MTVKRMGKQMLAATIMVIVMAMVGALYYTVRVKSNDAYLTGRNFRVLNMVTRQFWVSVGTYRKMLESDAKAFGQNPTKGTGDAGSDEEFLKGLASVRHQIIEDVDFDYVLARAPDPTPVTAKRLDPTVEIGIPEWRRFEIASTTWLPKLKKTTRFSAAGSIEKLVPSSVLLPGVFDDILLTKSTGEVLVAVGRNALRAQRIHFPLKTESKDADSNGSAADLEYRQVFPIDAGGTGYLAFCQPLGGNTVETDTQPRVICGIVNSAQYRADKFALNPFWALTLSLGLFGAILSWPFLRVLSLGPRERLRVGDVVVSAFSLLMGAALFTVIALAVTSYAGGESDPQTHRDTASDDAKSPAMGRQLDWQLEEISGEIKESVTAEIRAALTLLRSETEKKWASFRKNPSSWNTEPHVRKMDPHPAYPFVDAIVWVDAAGIQRRKLFARDSDEKAPLIPVRDRDYFQRASTNRLWRLDDATQGEPWSFVMEPVRSRTSGEFRAILAAPVRTLVRDAVEKNEVWMATASTSLVSAIRPLMPPGFGFAIVDRDGGVLFHSTLEGGNEQNFIVECDNDPGLRSVLYSRSPHWINARYWGRDHRLYVQPIEDLPLFLIVFQEKGLLRTFHLEVVTVALVFFLVLLCAYGAIAMIARLAAPREGAQWLLPRVTPGVYPWLTLLWVVLGAALLWDAFGKDTASVLRAAYVVPAGGLCVALSMCAAPYRRLRVVMSAIAIACFVLLLWPPSSSSEQLRRVASAAGIVSACAALVVASWRADRIERPTWKQTWMVASAVAALLVLVGIPSYAFFRVAWTDHRWLLLRHDRIETLRRLEDQRARVRTEPFYATYMEQLCGTPSTDAKYRDAYEKAVHSVNPCRITVQDVFCGGTELSGEPRCADAALPPREETPLLTWAAELVPIPDDFSVELRHASCAKLEERPGRGDGSSYASFPFSLGHEPAGLAAILVGLVGLVFLMRSVVRKVFLLDFVAPTTLPIADLAGEGLAKLPGKLLLVCPVHCRQQPILDRTDLKKVDLGRLVPEQVAALCAALAGEEGKTYCFYHLEQLARGGDEGEMGVAVLEAAARSRQRVIVLSEIDPADAFGVQPLAGANAEDLAAFLGKQRHRWVRIFGAFVTEVADDDGDPQFRDALLAELSPAHFGGSARTREILETIDKECGGHARLQEVGRELVRSPGLSQLAPKHVIRHIREVADGYYEELWNSLSTAERALLGQLARGSLVNPQSGGLIHRLMTRRIIVRTPFFRIMNRSFERFVMSHTSAEAVKIWETTGAASLWSRIRVPLLILLVAVAVFLYYTQRDLLPSVVALLTGIVTAIPQLVKLFDFGKVGIPASPQA